MNFIEKYEFVILKEWDSKLVAQKLPHVFLPDRGETKNKGGERKGENM